MGRRSSAAAPRGRGAGLVRGALRFATSLAIGLLELALFAWGSHGFRGQAAPTRPAPPAVAAALGRVPPTTLDAVGAGHPQVTPARLPATTPALTAGGLPEVLYVGAEYCPFCAAERWAVAVALSRFGTLGNLGVTESSTWDVYPGTATLSFYRSTYRSPWIAFAPVELQSNRASNVLGLFLGRYTALQTPTRQQAALMQQFDAAPYVATPGAIPFIDIGNQRVVGGAMFSPGVLGGLSAEQIATALANPASPVARSVDAAANVLTAAICELTHDRPAAVCTSPGVRAGAAHLT